MKIATKCASVIIASIALMAASLVTSAAPANAVASGPTNCFSKAMNNFGAWPAAYASCSSGGGRFRVLGKFRNLANDTYTSYGACVTVGKTSTVYAAGYFDSAIGASAKLC